MLKYGDITDVGVIAYINKEGETRPLYIVWEDPETGNSEKFKIDRIVESAEIVPGHLAWQVIVKNNTVILHCADGKWYTVKGVTSIWKPGQ